MQNPPVFRTPMPPFTYDFTINYHQKHCFIGSCFAQNIGQILSAHKFDLNLNPFGILYNPASIATGLQRLLLAKEYIAEELFLHNELWHSFDHHSSFSGTKHDQVLQKINQSLQKSRNDLLQANNIFITFGTARAYFLKKTGKIVANCHKLPAYNFEQKYLSLEYIVETYQSLIQNLLDHNPNLRIILTISPIRHLKDGLKENFLNKSLLRLAIRLITEEFPSVVYFPSYEIMTDDLRDYRFYEKDMLHPNQQAIDYIMEYFKHAFFDRETHTIYKRIHQWNKAAAHRFLHNDTQAAKLFHQKLEREKEKIKTEYPVLADKI